MSGGVIRPFHVNHNVMERQAKVRRKEASWNFRGLLPEPQTDPTRSHPFLDSPLQVGKSHKALHVEYGTFERLVPSEGAGVYVEVHEARPRKAGAWRPGCWQDGNPGALPRGLAHAFFETEVGSQAARSRRRILARRRRTEQRGARLRANSIGPLIPNE